MKTTAIALAVVLALAGTAMLTAEASPYGKLPGGTVGKMKILANATPGTAQTPHDIGDTVKYVVSEDGDTLRCTLMPEGLTYDLPYDPVTKSYKGSFMFWIEIDIAFTFLVPGVNFVHSSDGTVATAHSLGQRQ